MWRCKKCYIVLLLFFTIFSASFVRFSDVSAVADYTVSLNPYNQSYSYICGSANTPSCSSYRYMVISNTGASLSSCSRGAGPVMNNSLYGGLREFDPIIIDISSQSQVQYYSNQGMNSCLNSTDFQFTFTLKESYGSDPSGSISITSNGTFDVSSYAVAEVDVPAPPVTTPYDDKLDSLISAVYIVAGTMLVIYFFYALYRIYMGGRT